VRAIVGQQLSVAAARAIYGRLTELFGGRAPAPQELLDQDPELLRSAVGLSRAKVVFLRSLAEHVLGGDGPTAFGGVCPELDRLQRLDDDAIVAELTALAEPWRPYRSAACRLLWRSLSNAPL